VLPRAAGRARALGLALTGEKLSAEKAAGWGLVWDCVEDADLRPHAAAMAARLAALPSHAVGEMRALFAASERNTLVQQLALERERQEQLLDGACFTEGLQAFHDRRPPKFPPRQA
jgi:2-(1,2-epoxy-1,2-dihydrophenyl)acetyl-CoA isomerase